MSVGDCYVHRMGCTTVVCMWLSGSCKLVLYSMYHWCLSVIVLLSLLINKHALNSLHHWCLCVVVLLILVSYKHVLDGLHHWCLCVIVPLVLVSCKHVLDGLHHWCLCVIYKDSIGWSEPLMLFVWLFCWTWLATVFHWMVCITDAFCVIVLLSLVSFKYSKDGLNHWSVRDCFVDLG